MIKRLFTWLKNLFKSAETLRKEKINELIMNNDELILGIRRHYRKRALKNGNKCYATTKGFNSCYS